MISNHELCQFLKLPLLVQHYLEHREQNKNLGFVEFIGNHYAKNESNQQERNQHKHLPFKCHDECIGISFPVTIGSSVTISIHSPLHIYRSVNTVHYQTIVASAYLSTIWQPPKLG